MKRVGYNPSAFIAMLQQIKKNSASGSSGGALHGFAKTHPDPQVRIDAIKAQIGNLPVATEPASRAARFAKAMASL